MNLENDSCDLMPMGGNFLLLPNYEMNLPTS